MSTQNKTFSYPKNCYCIYVHINVFGIVTHNNIYTDAAEILQPSREIKHVKERESITLRCVGVGHPPPLVQWRKLNGSLSDRVTITAMSMSTNEGNVTRATVDLNLTRASREDTATYMCSASNLLNIATRNVSLIVQCMQLINLCMCMY